MNTEQKIWASLALFFFTIALTITGKHAFWFTSTSLAPLLIDRVIAVLRGFHPLPLVLGPPRIALFVEGMGTVYTPLLFLLQDYVPPVAMLLSVTAAAMGFFCVLMMIRPIEINFGNGILFGMFLLSMNLVDQEFGSSGWPGALLVCLYWSMVIIRTILD